MSYSAPSATTRMSASYEPPLGRHVAGGRVDRGDALLAELDARLRELAVRDPDRGRIRTAEEDVELPEAEREGVVLVDQRDANLVGERVGEAARQLQPAEPGSKDHDVLHAAPTLRSLRRALGSWRRWREQGRPGAHSSGDATRTRRVPGATRTRCSNARTRWSRSRRRISGCSRLPRTCSVGTKTGSAAHERAHHLHLESGEVEQAARAAFWIGLSFALRDELRPG